MRSLYRENYILIIIIITLFSAGISAEEWPNWRGPDRTGISEETRWNPEALKNLKVLWRAEVGAGHSSVSVKGKYAYTMGNAFQIKSGEKIYFDTVFCFDKDSGKEIWRYSYPCSRKRYPGPRITPSADGNRLYTLSWEGHVFCFDAEEGDVIWKKHLVKDNLSLMPHWGFSGSPLVYRNLLILTAGKSGVALDKMTGRVVWKSEPVKCTLPGPVLFKYKGRDVTAFLYKGKMLFVDPLTGTVIKTLPWAKESDIDPLIIGARVYMPERRKFTVFDISGDKERVVMENPEVKIVGFLNFIVMKDHLFAFSLKKNIVSMVCIDINKNKLKWKKNLGTNWASVSGAGDKLLLITGDGILKILESNVDKYSEISSARVIDMSDNSNVKKDQQNHCWTMPVLSGKKIYVRCNYGNVVCVDVSK